MVASIILMLQSLNITRQNTTLTLSFPFYIDVYYLHCLHTNSLLLDIQGKMELGQRKSKFYRFYWCSPRVMKKPELLKDKVSSPLGCPRLPFHESLNWQTLRTFAFLLLLPLITISKHWKPEDLQTSHSLNKHCTHRTYILYWTNTPSITSCESIPWVEQPVSPEGSSATGGRKINTIFHNIISNLASTTRRSDGHMEHPVSII